MRAYKFALVLFVILAIFLVVPFGGTNVLNSLYRPHIILMYSFAATFPFVGLAMATRGQSLVEVLQKSSSNLGPCFFLFIALGLFLQVRSLRCRVLLFLVPPIWGLEALLSSQIS